MMSFANVPLSDSESSDVAGWIADNIKPEQLFPLASRSWPGMLTYGPILNPSSEEPRPVRIGSLFWPWGASRFARAHFVVTTQQVEAIRKKANVNGESVACQFKFSDGENSIVTDLWMLPCIPLSKAAAGLGMYLLTLVDDRYWWRGVQVSINVEAGTTLWTDLYDLTGEELGVAIDVSPVAADYLTPTIDYTAQCISAPYYLDAVAFSIGQRITREFDGTVKAQNYSTSAAILTANQSAGWVPYAGGQFDFNPRS